MTPRRVQRHRDDFSNNDRERKHFKLVSIVIEWKPGVSLNRIVVRPSEALPLTVTAVRRTCLQLAGRHNAAVGSILSFSEKIAAPPCSGRTHALPIGSMLQKQKNNNSAMVRVHEISGHTPRESEKVHHTGTFHQ
jgi:hypothetical protein